MLGSFLSLLLLCLGSSVMIFLVIDFVGNSKEWLARPPRDVYVYYLNYLPHILYLVCPMALLLASVFSIGNLARHLELVALRSAGVSIARIISPIVACGLLASGLMLWFENRVMPDANHKRFEINEPRSESDEGGDPLEKFNYIYTASDGSILFFDYYSGHRNAGQGVTLLMQPKDGPLQSRIDAKSMAWDSSGWVMKDGTRRKFKGSSSTSASGAVDALAFKEMRLPELKDRPADLLDERVHPEEMGLKEMDRRIAILKRSGESARALETQKHFRLSSSLVNLLMTLIGAAMSVHTIKSGLARNFGIALLITFLYYVALRLGLVMGENGSLSPIAGAWFGNILFAPLAFFLYWRAARI